MSQAGFGELAHMQDRWRNDPNIPGWKKDGMIALVDALKRKVADNHNQFKGVELYYPEDCNNHDVFFSVAYAIDALIIPTSNGFVMREIGSYDEVFGIQ